MRSVFIASIVQKTVSKSLTAVSVPYDNRNWLRISQIEAFQEFFERHSPLGEILEVSPGWNGMWAKLAATRYTSVDFPEFDICRDVLDRTFDFVIADQVLERVPDL